ncbi:hypothetical protein EJB05_27174, partial [Eragrostis curvula]
MATGLVSSLLSSLAKLADLLPSPPAVSWPSRGERPTVSEDLQRLQRLLRRIQATLEDAGEREVRDSSVKLWLEELRDVALGAEDVLDDHRYELLRRRVQERQGGAASRKRKHDDGLDQYEEYGGMRQRIGEITRRFEEISRDRAALQLGPEDGERISGRDSKWESRTSSHLLDESLVFGRLDEKEGIIESVLYCSQGTGTQVLPVVGMGGIGKTTVAQMVYNHGRVKEAFDLRGWVHVSQITDLRKLTIAITKSLTRKQCGYNELSVAHHALKKTVDEKSVFLVLDDVWNEPPSFWQDLLGPFKSAKMVMILLTTRSKEVARLVQTVRPVSLGSLPEEHCWLLFRRYAFGNRVIDEKSRLVQVGKKIMQKCGGLPLAVKSIGCLLRSKMDMQTWMEISESEFWENSDDNEEYFDELIERSLIERYLDLNDRQYLERRLLVEEHLFNNGKTFDDSHISLYIARCPELFVFRKEKLPYRPQQVFVDDCLLLKEWCDEQELYYQVPEMVKISDLERAKEHGVSYFQSFKHLSVDIFPEKGQELILTPDNWLSSDLRLLRFCCESHSVVSSIRRGPSTIRRLEIRGCPMLVALMGLEELDVLHTFIIEDCPLLYILPETKFPPRLSSLTLHGCHKLLSLHLNVSDPSMFTELEVSDCQRLMHIKGLRYFRNLESLLLLHCPLLELRELLPCIPESIAVFLCPKLKRWCDIQSIEYQYLERRSLFGTSDDHLFNTGKNFDE